MGTDIGSDLIGIEAVGSGDRLAEHLHRGIAEGDKAVTQWIETLARRACLVALQYPRDAGKIEGRRGHKDIRVDDTVEQGPELDRLRQER
jgi:hypothetical protein